MAPSTAAAAATTDPSASAAAWSRVAVLNAMGITPTTTTSTSTSTNGTNANTRLEFHVISWHGADDASHARNADDGGQDSNEEEEDEDDEGGGGASSSSSSFALNPYVIRAFGVRDNGRSVALTITGFTPYFFVKIPTHHQSDTRRSMQVICESVRRECERRAPDHRGGGFKSATLMERCDFWGFNNNTKFLFIRVCFGSVAAMRMAAKRFQHESLNVTGMGKLSFAVYESHIDPLLRFFHVRDLRPAGWIAVDTSGHSGLVRIGSASSSASSRKGTARGGGTTCNMEFQCPWTSVCGVPDRDNMAPLVLAGFDIECNSAHGDFPQARKDYRKLAMDIDQAWDRLGLSRVDEYRGKRALMTCMRGAFWGPASASVDTPTQTQAQRETEDAAAEDYVRCGNMSRLQLKVEGLTPGSRGGRR